MKLLAIRLVLLITVSMLNPGQSLVGSAGVMLKPSHQTDTVRESHAETYETGCSDHQITVYDGQHVFRETASPQKMVDILNRHSSSNGKVRDSGGLWQGSNLLALVDTNQWLEIACLEPTTAVAVRFLGDDNDGWARVLVDGREVWRDNTYGPVGIGYDKFVEIHNLSYAPHTLRIEAIGQVGREGGDMHVTMAAVSCQTVVDAQPIVSVLNSPTLSPPHTGVLYLPLVEG